MHKPAPGPAFWPGFIPLQHDHYCTAHYPLQAALYGSISDFLLRAASKYGAMLSGHSAVPVLCSLRCGPGFEFGLKSFANQVKSQHSRQCPPPPTAASVSASSVSSAAAAKVSSVNSGTLSSSQISSTCKQNCQKQQGAKFDSNFKTKQTENK